MDWLGKSSKVEDQPCKNDMESLGIRFEPILFYPDRNEYELRIELSGCTKDLIKVTYDRPSAKLKVQGQKQKKNFVHQFPVPADCLATGIYGRFRGDVLHIVMPRLLSEWPASKDALSKQEDDQKASSDRKTTQEAGEGGGKDHDKLPAPPPSDRRTIDEVRERGGKDRDKLPARVPAPLPSDQKTTDEVRERGGKDRDKLSARVPAPPPSEQRTIDEVKERGGKYRDELPARVPAPLPSDQKTTDEVRERVDIERILPSKVSTSSISDMNTTGKSKLRDEELFPEISAPPPTDRESSRSVKELREKYQKKLSEIAAPPPVPSPLDHKTTDNARERLEKILSAKRPPPPPAAAPAPATSDWKSSDTGARDELEEDQEPPSTVVPASPSSTSGPKVSENAKIVSESKASGTGEKKPSADGNEKLGLIATVKETGKAAAAAAMKEENRRVVMLGAAVLAIVVIGVTSLKSSNKKVKN